MTLISYAGALGAAILAICIFVERKTKAELPHPILVIALLALAVIFIELANTLIFKSQN